MDGFRNEVQKLLEKTESESETKNPAPEKTESKPEKENSVPEKIEFWIFISLTLFPSVRDNIFILFLESFNASTKISFVVNTAILCFYTFAFHIFHISVYMLF